jgi:hypothetical protein
MLCNTEELPLIRLHGVISQKIEFFIITAVRTYHVTLLNTHLISIKEMPNFHSSCNFPIEIDTACFWKRKLVLELTSAIKPY